MELRQLRYVIRIIELGSMGRAAADLGLGVSALSQQVSRLEGELSARLFQRTSAGAVPTDAGLAFCRQARLAVRHADEAMQVAQQARQSGHVRIGLAPSTAAVLALPLMHAMRERYPDIRLQLVEHGSSHLAAMLDTRQLDLAILFGAPIAQGRHITPLLDEKLFVVGSRRLPAMPRGRRVHVRDLGPLPLLLPSRQQGLRALVMAAFARASCTPVVRAEIDGLAVLMDAVRAGVAATILPGAAVSRLSSRLVRRVPLADPGAERRNVLVSLPDDELPSPALAARVALRETIGRLVGSGAWMGATMPGSAAFTTPEPPFSPPALRKPQRRP